MIITSEFFSFNVWEWFLHSSVLERTESDLLKINWLRGVILLNPVVLVPWGRFPLCHTPIRPISAFSGSDLNLDCGLRDHVITRFASVGIRARLWNMVISFCYFCFFSVPLSISAFASIFLFFVSSSSKKKKGLYFILNHINQKRNSILKRKKKKQRERN